METGQIVSLLANAGVAGIVLLWFMIRLEKRLEDLTRAVSELQKTITVLVDRTDRGAARDFFVDRNPADPVPAPNPEPTG